MPTIIIIIIIIFIIIIIIIIIIIMRLFNYIWITNLNYKWHFNVYLKK